MSSIDERIVEMQFDNKQFESGVKTTLDSLDKLNESLSLDGAKAGLKNISDFAHGFNLDSIADGVDALTDRFSVLGTFGARILENLADSFYNLGVSFAKSLTVDQITEGWNKYESGIRSTLTVMNQGDATLEEAEHYMEKLSWYADVTSFDMNAMSTALGGFTAAGIDLDEAIPTIMGIGNSITYAGKSAKQGAAAFDIYAKAMGTGYLNARQYNSLLLGGFWTKKMTQQAIEIAEEQHELIKINETTWKTRQGLEVTADNIYSTLGHQKGKWLTSKVMNELFATMGGSYADSLAEETLAYQDQHDTILSLDEAMSVLDVDHDEMAQKYLESATLCRTYADAIDAVADAVSTLFGNNFKYIFGNVEEATELWTNFQNILLDIITGPLSAVSSVLDVWYHNNGRLVLIETIKTLYNAVKSFLEPIGIAFERVFGGKSVREKAYALNEFLASVRRFFSSITLSEKRTEELANAWQGVFSILHAVGTAFGFVMDVLKPLWKIVGKIAGAIVTISSYIGQGVTLIAQFWENLFNGGYFTNPFLKLITKLKSFNTEWEYLVQMFDAAKALLNITDNSLEGILGAVKLVGKGVLNLLVAPFAKLGEIFGINITPFKDVLLDLHGVITEKLGKALEYLKTLFQNTFGENATFFSVIKTLLDELVKNLKTNYEKLKELVPQWWGQIKSFFGKDNSEEQDVTERAHRFTGIFGSLVYAFNSLIEAIKSFFDGKTIKDIMDDINAFLTADLILAVIKFLDRVGKLAEGVNKILSSFFGELGNTMKVFQKNIKASSFKKIAEAILILVGAIVVLTLVDTKKMIYALGAIAVLMTGLAIIARIITGMKTYGVNDLSKGANTIMIAGAVTMMSLAFAAVVQLVKDVDEKTLLRAAVIVVAMGVFMGLLAKYTDIKIPSGFGVSKGTGMEMVKMALALFIMAKAFEQFSTLDPTALDRGLQVLLTMGAFIAAITFIQGKWGGDVGSGATAFFKMGATFTAIAFAFKTLGEIDNLDEVASALTGISGMFALIIGIAAIGGDIAKGTIDFTSVGTAFLLMGLSLIPIAYVMRELSTFSPKQMDYAGQALKMIGIFMASMMAVMAIATIAISKFSGFAKFGSRSKGTGRGGILGIFLGKEKSSEYKQVGTSILSVASAFLVMSAAVLIIAEAIKILSDLTPDQLKTGLLGIAGALGVFVLAAGLITALDLTAAITALGNAFLKMGIALVAAGAGLALIAVAIVPFAAAIVAAAPLIGLAITAIINMFGMVIGAICDVLITNAPKLVETLYVLLRTVFQVLEIAIPLMMNFLGILLMAILIKLNEMMPPLVENIFNLIITFVNALAATIRAKKSELSGALINLLTAIFELLWQLLTDIISGIVGVFSTSLAGRIEEEMNSALEDLKQGNVIGNALGLGEAVGENTTEGAADAIEQNKEAIFNAAYEIPGAATEGYEKGLKDQQEDLNGIATDSLVNQPLENAEQEVTSGGGFFGLGQLMNIEAANGLADPEGMTALLGSGTNSIEDLLGAMNQTVETGGENGEGATGTGKNMLLGIDVGMNDQGLMSKLLGTARGVGEKIIAKLNEATGVNSPSIYSIITGEYIDEGLIVGLKNKEGDVEDQAEALGNQIILNLKAPLQLIQSILDEELELDPTITPILDLSKVDNGLETLNKKYEDAGIINAASAYWSGISFSEKITHLAAADMSTENDKEERHSGITKVINYTQINSSPKALDESEIDRRNKTAFSKFVSDPDTTPDTAEEAEMIRKNNAQWAIAYDPI